jgi:hypothetical protein
MPPLVHFARALPSPGLVQVSVVPGGATIRVVAYQFCLSVPPLVLAGWEPF